MSGFTDEAVKQKLSALNESQDSIVTVAQWLMFHRRQTSRTAELWLQRIKDPSTTASKRLNLMYLANELVQQSKIKKKDDILAAFLTLVGDGMIVAYRGAPPDVQNKLKRLSEVWRQRNIFDQASQEAMEAQIMEIDKSRPQTTRKALGGALFPADGARSSTPVELQPLMHMQQALSKAQLNIRPALDAANKAYTALTSGTTPLPSPPLYAAHLNALAKDLALAEAAVSETLKTRQNLIASLEKLLKANRAAVTEEEKQHQEIRARHAEVESKKRVVEDAIMRGLSSTEDLHSAANSHNHFHLGDRPEIERFTPPPASSTLSAAEPILSDTTHDLPPENDHSVSETSAPLPSNTTAPVVQAADTERSSTPPGMPLPPSYQHGRGQNGSFFQGDGTTTAEEVPPMSYDGMYDPPISAARKTSTPPAAPVPETVYFEPIVPVAVQPPPQSQPQSRTTMPGLSSTVPPTSLDPRKRPASTVNASLDPRRRTNGKATSPTKRRRTSEDEFVGLPGLGGENGLEGLDKEVVGMLGQGR